MLDGLGYRDWTTGEVPDQATIDQYLQSQVVMRFATAAARDAAITLPKEGAHAYLDDSDKITVHDGTAWRDGPGGRYPFNGFGGNDYFDWEADTLVGIDQDGIRAVVNGNVAVKFIHDGGTVGGIRWAENNDGITYDSATEILSVWRSSVEVLRLDTDLRLGGNSLYFGGVATDDRIYLDDDEMQIHLGGIARARFTNTGDLLLGGDLMGFGNTGSAEAYIQFGNHGLDTAYARIVVQDAAGVDEIFRVTHQNDFGLLSAIDEIQCEDGSAGDPAYTYRNSPTSGHWYSSAVGGFVSTSVNATEIMRVATTGIIPVVSPTPAAGTAWVVGAFGELRKASSSRRYKTITADAMPLVGGDTIARLAAAVLPYHYTADREAGLHVDHVSLLAEDAYEIDHRFAFLNDNGQPEDVNDRTVIGHLIREIDALWKAIA